MLENISIYLNIILSLYIIQILILPVSFLAYLARDKHVQVTMKEKIYQGKLKKNINIFLYKSYK